MLFKIFKAKNLSNSVSLPWKLDNPHQNSVGYSDTEKKVPNKSL